MPNRFVQRNGSMAELLTRVPMNRGSLLKSIDNLLKTIETSENAVMIPTLLKDKVRVDACELLFVAKILKASILGHSDLVEFYMNHIGHTSSVLQQPSAQGQPPIELLSPSSRLAQSSPMASPLSGSLPAANSIGAGFGNGFASAMPPLAEVPPLATGIGQNGTVNGSVSTATGTVQKHYSISSQSTCSTSSTASSQATTASTTTGGASGAGGGTEQQARSPASSTSWVTATSQQQQQQPRQHQSAAQALSGAPSSLSSSEASSFSSALDQSEPRGPSTPVVAEQPAQGPEPDELGPAAGSAEALLVAAQGKQRQPQPPSLLQLTTTNNHINSVADLLASGASQQKQLGVSLEQLSGQLASMAAAAGPPPSPGSNGAQAAPAPKNHFDAGALSISTAATAANIDQFLAGPTGSGTPSAPQPPGTGAPPSNGGAVTPTTERLRSSRSAGCLFRANSGASSPRTPNHTTPSTPYPQAETLAGAAGAQGLVGDPKALVRLLLQVEQLKSSIGHVTTLLESVVELYKKSIDNIA